MRTVFRLIAVVCVSAMLVGTVGTVAPFAATASAQDNPGKKPPPAAKEPPAAKKPATDPAQPAVDAFFDPPPAAKVPATAKDFQPPPTALPKNVKFVEGMPVFRPKAEAFWTDPTAKGLVDAPKGKHAFALEAEGGKPGTVFIFEYDKLVPRNLEAYLSLAFVQVIEGAPSVRHPEQCFAEGRFQFVLSFPLGDPAAEWFKQHLRETGNIPAPLFHDGSNVVRKAMSSALEDEDPDAGLAAFAASPEDARRSAECLRLAGQFHRWKGEWAEAEKHYRAAWELIRTLKDPLDAAKTFDAAAGLGYAEMNTGKLDDAIAAFRTAKAYGIAREVEGSAVWGPYNLCCALAKAKRHDEAVVELREAVAANAEIKPHAREDSDIEDLRKREDVQKLLAD